MERRAATGTQHLLTLHSLEPAVNRIEGTCVRLQERKSKRTYHVRTKWSSDGSSRTRRRLCSRRRRQESAGRRERWLWRRGRFYNVFSRRLFHVLRLLPLRPVSRLPFHTNRRTPVSAEWTWLPSSPTPSLRVSPATPSPTSDLRPAACLV